MKSKLFVLALVGIVQTSTLLANEMKGGEVGNPVTNIIDYSVVVGGISYDIPESEKMYKLFLGNDVTQRFLKNGSNVAFISKEVGGKKADHYFNLDMAIGKTKFTPFCGILLNVIEEVVKKKPEKAELSIMNTEDIWKINGKVVMTGKELRSKKIITNSLKKKLEEANRETIIKDEKKSLIDIQFLQDHKESLFPIVDKCLSYEQAFAYQKSLWRTERFVNLKKEIVEFDALKNSVNVISNSLKEVTASDKKDSGEKISDSKMTKVIEQDEIKKDNNKASVLGK